MTSISYILWLLLTHTEKSGVCKVIQGGILKPALLCRDYRSGGTLMGVGKFLKVKSPDVVIVAVEPKDSSALLGHEPGLHMKTKKGGIS